jgi:hypothetical protein
MKRRPRQRLRPRRFGTAAGNRSARDRAAKGGISESITASGAAFPLLGAARAAFRSLRSRAAATSRSPWYAGNLAYMSAVIPNL